MAMTCLRFIETAASPLEVVSGCLFFICMMLLVRGTQRFARVCKHTDNAGAWILHVFAAAVNPARVISMLEHLSHYVGASKHTILSSIWGHVYIWMTSGSHCTDTLTCEP